MLLKCCCWIFLEFSIEFSKKLDFPDVVEILKMLKFARLLCVQLDVSGFTPEETFTVHRTVSKHSLLLFQILTLLLDSATSIFFDDEEPHV